MNNTENNSMRKEIVSEEDLKTKGFEVITSDEIEIIITPMNVDISDIKK